MEEGRERKRGTELWREGGREGRREGEFEGERVWEDIRR